MLVNLLFGAMTHRPKSDKYLVEFARAVDEALANSALA
jgi:hypothetical protein